MAFSAGAGAALSTRVGIDGMNSYLSGMKRIGDETDKQSKRMNASLSSMGDKAGAIGKKWTRNVTLPVIGLGAASWKMSKDFNSSMANVATMTDGSAKRINGLKRDIQEMAIDSGKSTGDLADGMYQVLSAFGDTADAVKRLDIANKASKAGMSTTTEAIDLLSAVTKGYGDTSVKAMQHVSDLSFQTVKLGQTNFPQLAASIGRVVPLAASLGVTQQELFGVMATATGVTGKAAEVSTQYRGILQSLSAPTERMSKLYEKLGVKNGESLIKQKGFVETLRLITDEAKRTNTPLQEFIGSIEGQTLATALAGAQNENLKNKIQSMGSVTNSTTDALRQQTQGVNKAGFEWEQAQQKIAVAMQGVGDTVAPMVSTVAGGIATIAGNFAELPQPIQNVTLGIAGVAAVAGPTLMVFGQLASSVMALRGAFMAMGGAAMLANPIVAIGAAAVGTAAALGVLSLATNKSGDDSKYAKEQVEGFKNALDGLTGALTSEKTAQLQVMTARKQAAAATKTVKDLADAGKKGSKEYKDALLAQKTAQNQLDSALNNSAKAHRDASESVKDFKKEAKEASDAYKSASDNVKRAEDAIKNLKQRAKDGGFKEDTKSINIWKQRLKEAKSEQDRAKSALDQFKERFPELARSIDASTKTGKNRIKELKTEIDNLPSQKTVSIVVKTGKLSTNQFGAGLHVSNSGGPVPGPRGANKDSVLSYLTPGEYVINRNAVDKLGTDFLDGLNGYNRGGLVAAQRRANIADNPALALRQALREYNNANRRLSRAKGKEAKAAARQEVRTKADAVIAARRALASSAVSNRFAGREAADSRFSILAQGTATLDDDIEAVNRERGTNSAKLNALRAQLSRTRDPASRREIRSQINSAMERQLQLEQQRNSLIEEQNRNAHEAALNRARDTMQLTDANTAYAMALANSTGDITQKTNAINQALANEEKRRQILNETLANTAKNDAERADLINQLAQSVDASTALKEQLKQNDATAGQLLQAQLDQEKRRADAERDRANMSEAALRVFGGAGDIGMGLGANAFMSARPIVNNYIQSLSGYDPAIQKALSDTSNAGNSSGETANALYSGRQAV